MEDGGSLYLNHSYNSANAETLRALLTLWQTGNAVARIRLFGDGRLSHRICTAPPHCLSMAGKRKAFKAIKGSGDVRHANACCA